MKLSTNTTKKYQHKQDVVTTDCIIVIIMGKKSTANRKKATVATSAATATVAAVAATAAAATGHRKASSRGEYVQELIALLKAQYPTKGFYLNPNIKFEEVADDASDGDSENSTTTAATATATTGSGLRVVAHTAIPNGENLIVIPQSAVLIRSHEDTNNDNHTNLVSTLQHIVTNKANSNNNNNNGNLLKGVRAKMFALYNKCLQDQQYAMMQRYQPLEMWMAVQIMYLLSSPLVSSSSGSSSSTSNNKNEKMLLLLRAQIGSWPSEQELKDSFFDYWGQDDDDDNADDDTPKQHDIERVWGTRNGLTMYVKENQETVQQIFELIVYPILVQISQQQQQRCFVDTTLPSNTNTNNNNESGPQQPSSKKSYKEQLRNTFRYAFGLVYSRSHGDAELKIYPLVELFNGDTTHAEESSGTKNPISTVNVELMTGKWPFIRGGGYVDECNLPCSCVFANRNIQAGEELIISYGEDWTVNDFMLKYGTVPTSMLHPSVMKCDIRLWCPPEFIPLQEGSMRKACLVKQGFPLQDFKDDPTYALTSIVSRPEPVNGRWGGGGGQPSSYDMYTKYGREHDNILSVRQYLIIAVLADDYELQRNLTTGRLRGPLYEGRVLPLFCRLIDYNLNLLLCNDIDNNSSSGGGSNATMTVRTSIDDMEKVQLSLSSLPSSSLSQPLSQWETGALVARVAYRETLLMWRHAFVAKGLSIFDNTSSDDDRNNYKALFYEAINAPLSVCPDVVGLCEICGRSYPSMKCSRCKSVQYCSRLHQKHDWPVHKHKCKKKITKTSPNINQESQE